MGYPENVKHRPASRRNTLLRTIALAVLALSLILRPLAASLGELHEFAHHPISQHQDIDDLPAKASIAKAAQMASEGDGAQPLHVLLHFAHCCGQTAATPVNYVFGAVDSPPATQPAWRLEISHASARWTPPFRPPIAA